MRLSLSVSTSRSIGCENIPNMTPHIAANIMMGMVCIPIYIRSINSHVSRAVPFNSVHRPTQVCIKLLTAILCDLSIVSLIQNITIPNQ